MSTTLSITSWIALGVFLAAVLLLVYTYLGYPLALWAYARVRPRPVRRAPITPRVTIIVVGYNEAHRLPAKIDSCLGQNYPGTQLRVLVVSDGSTDETAQALAPYAERGVRLLPFAARRGKAACLNDAVAACTDDILVFTDARQRLHPDAVALLVANFADPAIGAVSGELVFEQDQQSGFAQGVDFYWKYEKFIRHHEALSGSVVGVTGALYAMRRACFVPIPAQTILDDVAIPMQAAMNGWRIGFEKGAIAYDRPSSNPEQERMRKVRTLAGNFQVLQLWPRLLMPGGNPLLLRYLSHKVLRLCAPWAMAAALASNIVLALALPGFAVLLALQVLGYAAPVIGAAVPPLGRLRPVRILSAFIHLNWFAVLALIEFVFNRHSATWEGAHAGALTPTLSPEGRGGDPVLSPEGRGGTSGAARPPLTPALSPEGRGGKSGDEGD